VGRCDAVKLISSRDNPAFKDLAKLVASSRERKRTGLSVIEGAHLLEAYSQRYGAPQLVVCCEGHEIQTAAKVVSLTAPLFRAVSQVEHGTGPLATIVTPAPALPTQITETCLLLDGLQDPGNLGTILRTAAAAGLRQVFLSADCVYAWSPKVLRSGMGAHFALDIYEGCDLQALFEEAQSMRVLATSSHAPKSLYATPLNRPVAWVFGNEGAGVSAPLMAHVQETVSIPMPGTAESLNVAAAVAICLFEQVRQRLG
jgi:RNA methyltransferase, TrmH family